jgi:hypothetical protein
MITNLLKTEGQNQRSKRVRLKIIRTRIKRT